MITLVVKWTISEDVRPLFMEQLNKLAKKSREELGCIKYDIMSNMDDKNSVVLLEKWLSLHFLEQHNQAEHYKVIVPEMIALSCVEPDVIRLERMEDN